MSFRDTPIQHYGISLVYFLFYLIVHLPVILMIPLDVTSAAHSIFFTGKVNMFSITTIERKMYSIDGIGSFINAPYKRFGLSLQWHGWLMFRNLVDLFS